MAFKDRPFVILLTHAKNYFAASVAQRALGIISLPVMTRLLSPDEYGIYSVFMSFVAVLMVVLSLNAYTSVGRYWYDKQVDFNRFVGTSVFVVGIILIISFVMLILFNVELSNLFSIPKDLILLVLPFVVIGIIHSLFQQIYMPQKKSKLIARFSVSKAYLSFGAGVCLALLMDNNRYYGFLLGQLIFGGIISGVMIKFLLPFYESAFEVNHLRYITGYSLPLIPYVLSDTILSQFDRIMINGYIGSTAAGLYSIAYNIGMLLTVLIMALLAAWTPDYFTDMGKKDYRKLDSDINKMFRLILIGAMFLILFGREIGTVLADKRYHESLKIVPIVTFGYIFMSLWQLWGRNIGYARKTIWNSIVAFTAGFTNIGLNIVFIPAYGYVAAAYTSVVSYMIMAFMGWGVSKWVLKVRVTAMKVTLKPLGLLILFYFFVGLCESQKFEFWLMVGIKIFLFGMFSLLIARQYVTIVIKHLFYFMIVQKL